MSGTNVVGTKTMLAGSPGFQPPEQLKSESVGLPSDIYAIRAVLLVIFGETQVWPGLSPYQIMFKVGVCNEKPTTTHLPLKVQKVCQSCFESVRLRPSAHKLLQSVLYMMQ